MEMLLKSRASKYLAAKYYWTVTINYIKYTPRTCHNRLIVASTNTPVYNYNIP